MNRKFLKWIVVSKRIFNHLWLKRVQNSSLQDVPLWHKNYFELKAIKILWLRRNFCPFFNYIKETKLGALPIWIIAWKNFLWPISVGYFCLSYCPGNFPPPLWSPSVSYLIPWLRMPDMPHFTFLFLNLSCMWGPHMYKCK